MKRYLMILALLIVAQTAWGECPPYGPKPRTQVVLEFGKAIVDNTKARNEWPEQVSDNTIGLTVSRVQWRVEVNTKAREISGQRCMYVDTAKLVVSIPRLDVYIDKKYKPGSCPYSSIKRHEDTHVRIKQNTLYSFKGTFQAALDKAAKSVKMLPITSSTNVDKETEKMREAIYHDLEPSLQKMSDEMKRKDAQIDTDKSYRRESTRCPKW